MIPVCTFLLSGGVLHHWLLVLSAAVFGIRHAGLTCQNNLENPLQFSQSCVIIILIKRFDQASSEIYVPERTGHRLKARLPLFFVKFPL
jgi:hypothetical protein